MRTVHVFVLYFHMASRSVYKHNSHSAVDFQAQMLPPSAESNVSSRLSSTHGLCSVLSCKAGAEVFIQQVPLMK